MKKLVMAFYYIWFGNPRVSGKWLKWNGGGHNPDKGDIASVHYPVKGAYDSSDERIIKYHLRLADKMGIDVLLTSVWSRTRSLTYTKKTFDKILKIAEDYKVKLIFYYEDLPNYNVKDVAENIIQLIKRYRKRKSFFTINGKPVIFLYARVLLQLGFDKWKQVVELVNKEIPSTFIADTREDKWIKSFDGGFKYTIIDSLFNKSNMERVYGDYIKKCGKYDKISCLTIMPGYDDSAVQSEGKEFFSDLSESLKRDFSIKRIFRLIKRFIVRLKNKDFGWLLLTFGIRKYAQVSRENGRLYKELWRYAIKADPDIVLITSFNEWHEGTEIEPSAEYGDEYVRLTKEFVKRFKKTNRSK